MQEEINNTMVNILTKDKTLSFKEAFIKTCLATKIIPDNRLIEDSKAVFNTIKSTAK